MTDQSEPIGATNSLSAEMLNDGVDEQLRVVDGVARDAVFDLNQARGNLRQAEHADD
ncbi:hypothetical protein [Rhodococcus sp. Leaf278]|uniref:hypothetical protein n=1 Tax=Rhodococcus sp. Leaf278 TaxID=1736319 RepID=UPI000A9248A1|nr:hypothetical protein [Rhodococcus sp. Leaf278]